MEVEWHAWSRIRAVWALSLSDVKSGTDIIIFWINRAVESA